MMSSSCDLKRCFTLAIVLVVQGIVTSAFSQSPARGGDSQQIESLITALSDHSKPPADLLDPNLSEDDRRRNLKYFVNPDYQLSLMPANRIPVVAGDSLSVPVKVHFDAKDGNSLNASADSRFVRRGGHWYFASFDFLAWPAYLSMILAGGILVGIVYAATVLRLGYRLKSHGPLGLNRIKMFVPIFWPSLFRYSR